MAGGWLLAAGRMNDAMGRQFGDDTAGKMLTRLLWIKN